VRWGWKFLLVVWAFTVVQVLLFRFINPPFTAMMVWDWIQGREKARLTLPGTMWYPLKEISPQLRKAVLAGEDQRFLSHHGFDFTEMSKALEDLVLKRGHRGASTITMQVARSVFLWPKRSWLRKVTEAYYTVLIEILWSKGRTFEIYLNTVDWGRGAVGAEAASRKYFRISCSHVSRFQAALLAAILPNPHRWSATNPTSHVLKRQKRILGDMEKMPLLS